jgi:hypothetical protein
MTPNEDRHIRCLRGRTTYPLAVDGHLCLVVDAQVFDLVDLPDALHVSSITASTEDHCNTRVRVDVPRHNKGSELPVVLLMSV